MEGGGLMMVWSHYCVSCPQHGLSSSFPQLGTSSSSQELLIMRQSWSPSSPSNGCQKYSNVKSISSYIGKFWKLKPSHIYVGTGMWLLVWYHHQIFSIFAIILIIGWLVCDEVWWAWPGAVISSLVREERETVDWQPALLWHDLVTGCTIVVASWYWSWDGCQPWVITVSQSSHHTTISAILQLPAWY